VFLQLISLSPSIKASVPVSGSSAVLTECNSFPKIFGGSQDHSYLYQIDVFNDYLAMGGRTWDYTLTATLNRGSYIALHSISVA
jgi:hypothetical protein